LIAVQETFFFYLLDEHQAVEHDGCVPFAVFCICDAGDLGFELVVLDFEFAVEFFYNFFVVLLEMIQHSVFDIEECDVFFFVEGKAEGGEFLEEEFRFLGVVPFNFGASERFGRCFGFEVPDLGGLFFIGEDDEVFVVSFSCFGKDLSSGLAVWQRAADSIDGTMKNGKSSFLCDSEEFVGLIIDGEGDGCTFIVIPAHFVEEGGEVEVFDVFEKLSFGEHGSGLLDSQRTDNIWFFVFIVIVFED
jgi:hypothetical protein